MSFLFRHQTQGGHVHIAVYVGATAETTYAKSGDLVLSVGPEWEAFRALLDKQDSIIIEERQP